MALKNPNGYGSVVKLSGKRRKPYAVRKTIGWDDRAYPIYAIIGYYETRKDALLALSEYNRDPYDIDASKSTFQEVYDLWSKDALPKAKTSLQRSYKAAYLHCAPIYGKQYKSLRKDHMQACIDNCGKGYSTRANIKLLLQQLDKYAFDHDIVSKCYSSLLDIGEKDVSDKHTVFTDDEVLALWKIREKPFVDETLFMLYTGCRISEVFQIECQNVHLNEQYMIGGIKTSYGKDRTIPIHSKLIPIIQDHLSDNKYVFHYKDNQNIESFLATYRLKWTKEIKEYGFNHLSHDCRHTFISKLDSAGVNKVALDRIVGHSSKTLGEKVYTHKTLQELQETIEKLVYGSVKT